MYFLKIIGTNHLMAKKDEGQKNFQNIFQIHHLCYLCFSLQSFFFQFNPLSQKKYNWVLIWVQRSSLMERKCFGTKMKIFEKKTINCEL